MNKMKKTAFIFLGAIAICLLGGSLSPVFAENAGQAASQDWSPMVAKIVMGLGLSLALGGSALGLSIGFQALLGGGQENFFKNIAVALMPSTQGIYGIVVFFTNMDLFESNPYSVAGRAAIAGIAMFCSAWYQGMVCAAGIRSVQEGRNSLANALVAGAMPETYAVFALVMTFIMQ